MRSIGWLALAVAVCGCSDEPAAVEKVPTSYYVRNVDLYRDTPDDICRFNDRDYLQKLIGRVIDALPERTVWTDFEDFNARPSLDGTAMEAVVRFHARSAEANPVMMFAVGPFDPKDCRVGQLTGGIGPEASNPNSEIIFKTK